MPPHHVHQRVDEERVVVGRGAPEDVLRADLLAQLLGVLNVQLVQGLDVVRGEGDGDEHEVLLAAFDECFDGGVCSRGEPGQRAYLRLPDEAVRVAEVELLHDHVDRCTNLSRTHDEDT